MHIKNAYSFDYNNFLLYSPINEISEEKTETAPLLKAVGSGWKSPVAAAVWCRFQSLLQALFLCAPFLSKMENVHLFSSSFPHFDKCHETSRIFPRTEQTFASARSFGVISWASFSRKNGPFGFGRAPSASQKALSKSKGTFCEKMNALCVLYRFLLDELESKISLILRVIMNVNTS